MHARSLDSPGTLDVYPLTAAVTAPENSLPLSSLSIGATAVGNGLGTNNKSGFSGLAGGYRDGFGVSRSQDISSMWWSATEYSASSAWYGSLDFHNRILAKSVVTSRCGCFVRLVRDLN